MTPDSKNPVQRRWIVYDNDQHEFSVYYNEPESRKEYESRIKQINDEIVGTDEYNGDEEVYLCQVISKAEVVEVGRDEQSDDALYRLIPYDCSAKSADAVLKMLKKHCETCETVPLTKRSTDFDRGFCQAMSLVRQWVDQSDKTFRTPRAEGAIN